MTIPQLPIIDFILIPDVCADEPIEETVAACVLGPGTNCALHIPRKQACLKQCSAMMDMMDIYIRQVRSLLEFRVPVWNAVDQLTKEEIMAVERIQMAFLQIVLGNVYDNYALAWIETKLKTLEKRRTQLNLICT